LQNFLEAMEEQIEANIHTTFGGAGGEQAAATDAELKSKYHLTDDQLFYVAEASHKFYQTYLSGRFLAFSNNPLNCTSTPMGIRDSGTLGADAAPRCACNDYYFESESNTNQVRYAQPAPPFFVLSIPRWVCSHLPRSLPCFACIGSW